MNVPQLPGFVHVGKTTEDLHDDLSFALLGAAAQAVDERGVFHLALCGGRTPEPFYIGLCIDVRFRAIPWKQTHIWLVDERCVPLDDAASNFRLIRECLVDHVPTPRRQVHPMPVLESDGDLRYEEELRRSIGGTEFPPRLDFVLLGMGEDGHVASLFPDSPAVAETRRLVVFNESPAAQPSRRMTMTFPLLNAARQIAILVTGASKAASLRRVQEQWANGADPRKLPVTGLDPLDGQLGWYLDPAAAGMQEGPEAEAVPDGG